MIIFLNVVLHCVISHVLLVTCSDPLVQKVFSSETSSRVMGTESQVKQTRSRMACIASCIEPQCSTVIMEMCSNSTSKCQFNSVHCKHVKTSTTSEILLVSGQQLLSVSDYAVGRTEQNETTNTAKTAITTATTTTTQNYATSTAAYDTVNYGTTTRVVEPDTSLVTTQSNSIETEEESARTETTPMVAITAAETTGTATTTGNSNIVLGATSAETTTTTTTTTTEYPDTEATIIALATTSTLTQSEETSAAAETTTTTTAKEITTSGQLNGQLTTIGNSDTINTTAAVSTSSDTTQNEETSVVMETTTMSAVMETKMTTTSEIIVIENEYSMNNGTEELTTTNKTTEVSTTSDITLNETSAIGEISTLTVSMTTEMSTITAINTSENERSHSNATNCPFGYENWWGDKCYRLEDTAIQEYESAETVCINDTGIKNSHLLHGVDMIQEELDAINNRLTEERVYWVALKYSVGETGWKWKLPGQDGSRLYPGDVLYWSGEVLPPEGAGRCGAYNTTSEALQPEDCNITLPYICHFINGDG